MKNFKNYDPSTNLNQGYSSIHKLIAPENCLNLPKNDNTIDSVYKTNELYSFENNQKMNINSLPCEHLPFDNKIANLPLKINDSTYNTYNTYNLKSNQRTEIVNRNFIPPPPPSPPPNPTLFDKNILNEINFYLFGEKIDNEMYFKAIREKFEFIKESDIIYNQFNEKMRAQIEIRNPCLIFSFSTHYLGRLDAYTKVCDFFFEKSGSIFSNINIIFFFSF